MKAFHAYDIRGIYNQDFNKDDAYKIGFFLPKLLNTNKILVGRDVRESTPEIFEFLSNGITDAGADVYDIGLATTPMVYFATAKLGFDASVQITASHNPKQYNGMKISRTNALPVGYDSGLADLEKMMNNEKIVPADKKGSKIKQSIKDEYLTFLNSHLVDFSKLKVGIDCSNGMAALLIKEILGDAPKYIYDELDGTFPNHEANPLIPDNYADLQKLVRENNLDIGMIFDGDADRVMFVDEKGDFIPPDLIIAFLGHYFAEEKKETGKVLQDIRTSKAVGEYLSQLGFDMEIWRVGRAFAAKKLRDINGVFGGELAGHYYFRDFYFSDSGLLAAILVLRTVAKFKDKGVKLSEVIEKIRGYENSGEINFKIEQKQEAINQIVKHFKSIEEPQKILDFDGYRIEYEKWWFNVRPSNTEPYLRLIVEAQNNELLNEKVDEIKSIIAQFN
ncbi:MAG: phosphomannomutase/phosphoglucomutase [Bacteroidales bacterium]|nr:phosphomannomutase/phosphoglucomutase [Bacteroidales bacterium]